MNARRDRPAAVIFDVGGTILEERWFDLERALRTVLADPGVSRALSDEFRTTLDEQHRMHREVAFARWLLDRLPRVATPLEDLEDALWRSAVELVPRSGVGELLGRLAADCVPVAAISNAPFSGRIIAGELHRHGLLSLFRFVISSADVGLRKPHPAIFDGALVRLGAQAAESWFVGDTLAEDIVGAQAVGLQAIWLSDDRATPVPKNVTHVQDWASLSQFYAATRAERGAG
jgi:HAD superfamily hydrolase (TIGR01509 family)